MAKTQNQLTGKELFDYVEEHREEFDGDGDALCLAAGYGTIADDGSVKCDLPDFIKELSKAIEIDK